MDFMGGIRVLSSGVRKKPAKVHVALWIRTFPGTEGGTIRDVDSHASPD